MAHPSKMKGENKKFHHQERRIGFKVKPREKCDINRPDPPTTTKKQKKKQSCRSSVEPSSGSSASAVQEKKKLLLLPLTFVSLSVGTQMFCFARVVPSFAFISRFLPCNFSLLSHSLLLLLFHCFLLHETEILGVYPTPKTKATLYKPPLTLTQTRTIRPHTLELLISYCVVVEFLFLLFFSEVRAAL